MDFFDFAKEIETIGAEQYEHLAETMQVRELGGIFAFMAEQEKHHYALFDSWQRQVLAPPFDASTILGKAKDAFARLADHFDPGRNLSPVNYHEAYEKALGFEKKSIALYEEALPKTDPAGQKALLQAIINQEKAHAQFLTALMEFERNPGEWLENAEWYHLNDY